MYQLRWSTLNGAPPHCTQGFPGTPGLPPLEGHGPVVWREDGWHWWSFPGQAEGGPPAYDPGMDWFVCGNYASISCGTWLEFWSGAIGALVAAFVGGMVALMVVRSTKGHQSELAAEARVVAALADFQAALSELPRRYTDGREAIGQLVIQADAASNRITMDIDDFHLAKELSLWPLDLGVLTARAGQLHEVGDAESSHEAWKMLRGALGILIGTTQQWARTPARKRRRWAAELETFRKKLKADVDAILI